MIKRFVNIFIDTIIVLCFNYANAQEVSKQVDSLFKAVTSNNRLHFSGSVVVAENGNMVYQNAKGYANIDKKILNNANTNYSLASLSKVFTAVAVMQLKEKGKLNLDDPLSKYLFEFPVPEITIRQVLSHTSGLPDFEIFDDYISSAANKQLSYSDIIPALKKGVKLISAPGTKWHYSNIGFGLLALLVETVSHKTFAQYINENICIPAGMTNTYVDIPGSKIHDSLKAILYVNPQSSSKDITSSDKLKPNLGDPVQTVAGPGLIVSSINDLLKFDVALYSDKLLSAATEKEMFTPVKLNDGAFAQLEHAPLYNALGWGIDIDKSAGKIASHTGGSPGIATILLRNLSKKQVVIVLENTDNPASLSFGINAMNILNSKPMMHFRGE
jgi:CubicO group peptidase (beta-lactamase class C family)